MISPNENQSDLMPQEAPMDVDEFTSIVSLLDNQEASTAMPQPPQTAPTDPTVPSQTPSPKLTLRTKATVLAALLGTVPAVTVGGIGFVAAHNGLKQQINQQHNDQAQALIDTVNRFVFERYHDVQMMAQAPILAVIPQNSSTDAQVQAQQQATLEQFKQIYGIYDSIALFDVRGNVLVKTQGPSSETTTAQADVQAVVKTGKSIVSQPSSTASGQGAVYFSTPIVDAQTKRVIKVVRARLPLSALQAVTAPFDQQYQLFSNDGTIFLSNQTELLNRKIQEIFTEVPRPEAMQPGNPMIVRAAGQSSEQLLAYAATPSLKGMPNLNWGVTYVEDKNQAFQSIHHLAVALGLGTIATGTIVSTIAIALMSRTTRSLQVATDAVEKIGQGELDTRLDVQSHDELGRLGENINQMVEQLQMVLSKQARQAHYAQMLNELVNELRRSLKRDDILASAPAALREAIHTDRVIIYQFQDDWSGKITAESVAPEYRSILGKVLQEPFQTELIEAYRNGRVRAIHDINGEHLTPFHQELRLVFDSQANMVAPLIQNERLIGLICAHQCDAPREWEAAEVELFAQVAVQVGYALEQAYLLEYAETARLEAQQEAAELAKEQQQQKEFLQRRALELLMEVDPVSQGDLTIRAKVTPDEVGTIADSYNSIIRSLRQLVLDVQSATETVSQTASSNESSVQQLSQEARRQMAAITEALMQVQSTVESVKGVTARALEAEQGVHLAAATIADGDIAMNKTVAGISAIRETVSETAKKVKRLGEASQKISKVVNLINGFAAQTNLLALNAAIEAARAGEEGRGFAVVAEEVRSLAQQSAAATEEIEQLVEEIQTQTNDVVLAMESGTEQVVEGTQLVEETRAKLNEITAVSATINRLIGEISAATTVQTQAYETVSQTMEQVAMIADDSSKQSDHVAESFTRLLSVADALQVSVAQFKVN